MRFQTAVAAYMLAACGTEQAVTIEVVPEGLQDIDGRRPDGRRLHTQVKERAGGNTTLPLATAVAAIADAGDALRADPESSFVIVTDARPGAGLAETGWERPLADVIDPATKLADDVRALLGRCHLVCMDWDGINAATRTLLAGAHALPGAAADLLRARMLDDLLRAGGDQRDSDGERPIARGRSDVDVLAARVRELVDLEGLEQPVRDGLVEFVDFTTPLRTPVETFLTGIDVLPGHVAANLDVLRADELSQLFEALATDSYVVIAGPSGSGKSALMWRGAHELGLGYRLVRVRRVEADHVAAIARWIRTLAPDETTPVLVCADNIGRPHTAAWPALAAELLEQPGVRLLAASREEDFEPSFVRAGGVPLRPQLTPELGHEIAAQLEAREVPLRASAEDALADAHGLLMEFVAILTTGRRLEEVVTAQVHDRFAAERRTERTALRFVTAAHVAGLALDAGVLGELCDDSADLPEALATLSDEFLTRQPREGTWSGLHELRSSVVNRVLHEFPPPTESETIEELLTRLDARDATHLLRRTADRGDSIAPFLDTIGARVGQADAGEVASWIGTALAIDVLVHMRRCIETAERSWPPRAVGLVRFAWLRRFARFPDDMVPEEIPIQRYADSLLEPETDYGGRIAAALSGERVVELAAAALPGDAAALLEACASAAAPVLSTQQANAIASAHDETALRPFSRIVAALWVLCPDGHAAADRTFGPRSGRLDRIAREDCGVLRWAAGIDDRDPTGLLVSLQVFVASGELDQERRRELARIALDVCPEAVRIEIDPRGPKGRTSTAGVWGGGRFHRSTAANPYIEGRRPGLMSDSLDRLNAAQTWAQRLASQRALAHQLTDLAEAALERLLAAHYNAGRRRRWREQANEAAQLATELPAPPVPAAGEEALADHARDTLERIAIEFRSLGRDLDRPETYGPHARALRRAFSELWLPFRYIGPVGDGTLSRQIDTLRAPVMRLADLLVALGVVPRRGRRDRSTAYGDVADRIIAEARDTVLAREREAIEAVLPREGTTLHRAPGGAPQYGIAGDIWLVGCSPDAFKQGVYEAFEALGPAAKALLVNRVVMVAESDDGVFLPIRAFVMTDRGRRLLEVDEATRLIEDAGLACLTDPALDAVIELRDRVVAVSEVAANIALRESRFPVGELRAEAQRRLERLEAVSTRLTLGERGDELGRTVVVNAEAELRGESPGSQAAGWSIVTERGILTPDSLVINAVIEAVAGLALHRRTG